MNLPLHKTKIVCTIGPASNTIEKMIQLINAGMSVARLNYSHGGFDAHALVITMLRKASEVCKRSISILADLPGPKMRVGKLSVDSVWLETHSKFILTTADIIGNESIVSVSFKNLPNVVKSGHILYLNDGVIQLCVEKVIDNEVHCQVIVGGELRSNKGLNLPGIDLGIPAFTEHDYECMKSALENGVDAVSQSFVNNAGDLLRLKKAALELGYRPFVIAKIERSVAVENLDEILEATDGIMIARGDLGVEIAIEKIAIIQKQIIQKANLLGKPVITATQMLGSMVSNPRPTRAEVSDVSNAIYDGTDCVMLSEESAMGKYPVESVNMLAKIAVSVEEAKTEGIHRRRQDFYRKDNTHITDTISYNVYQSVSHLNAKAVFVQTQTGYIARMISRFKLPVWVMSVTSDMHVFRSMQFSYGLMPILCNTEQKDWDSFMQKILKLSKQPSGIIILVEAPSKDKVNATHRMSIVHLSA